MSTCVSGIVGGLTEPHHTVVLSWAAIQLGWRSSRRLLSQDSRKAFVFLIKEGKLNRHPFALPLSPAWGCSNHLVTMKWPVWEWKLRMEKQKNGMSLSIWNIKNSSKLSWLKQINPFLVKKDKTKQTTWELGFLLFPNTISTDRTYKSLNQYTPLF